MADDDLIDADGGEGEELDVAAVDIEPGAEVVEIITTAPGTLGPAGIVPVGTRAKLPIDSFSYNWMMPANTKSARILNALAGKAD